jgi:hypothetical protein
MPDHDLDGSTQKQRTDYHPSMFSPLAQYCSHQYLPWFAQAVALPLTNFGDPKGADNGLATF